MPPCPCKAYRARVSAVELGQLCAEAMGHLYHLISMARVTTRLAMEEAHERRLLVYFGSRLRANLRAALLALPLAARCLDPGVRDKVSYYLNAATHEIDEAHEYVDRALPNAGAFLDEALISMNV